MSNINASIKLGSGFLLKNAPVDLKTTAANITERDSYVTQGVLYKGATVYVEENDTRYRYTGVQPSGSDFSACWVVDTPAGDASTSIKGQIDQAIQEQVTNKIGDTIQAHSPVLDEVAKLDAEGLAYRKADGTFTEMTVSGQNGVQVATDAEAGTIVAELTNVGTAGTYTKVTTDAKGRVTAGENPTTLAGYGITDALPLSGGTMTGALKVLDPVDANDAVNKKYADSVALGFVPHEPARLASSVNVDGVYANGSGGTPGVGATFTMTASVIDGLELAQNDRVLLFGQTDAKQNGIYAVTAVTPSTSATLTRVDDFDGEPTVTYDGLSILISEGTHSGSVYTLQNRGNITFGTDSITFVETFSPASYSAGAGINISNNTVSVKQGTTVKVIDGNLEVASGTGNQGKVLVAGTDGAAASWQTISTDFQEIAPEGTAGAVMYHNGTEWTALAKGANGTILGVGADGNVAYVNKIEQGTF